MGNAMSGLRNDGEMRLVGAPTRRARSSRLAMALGAAPIMLGVLAAAIPTEMAAAAPTAAPSAAKPSALRYTVVNGDYLWGIAIKLGVKFVDLLTVNSFTMDTVIIPGQSVVVPEGGVLPPAAAPTASAAVAAGTTPAASGPYVVVSGDSLSTIAQRMGVTLPALLKANTLKVDSVIHPGTKLSVPTGGHMPAPTTLGAIDSPASTGQPVSANRVNDAAGVPPDAAATPSTGSAATGTAAAGQPPAQAALPAGYTNYTVTAGDYLVGIAAKNGVTLKALLAANDLITTSAILPGQQLSVPPATLPIPPADPDPAATTPDATSQGGGQSAAQQSIATVISFLEAQVGKPYAFNTEGPETFDCSGLVTAAYKQIGISLPHQSLLQSTKGTAVDWTSQPLLPGDLIFMFSTANPTVISHVGVVIDSERWIQAGGSPTSVKIGPLPNAGKIQAVRRIVQS